MVWWGGWSGEGEGGGGGEGWGVAVSTARSSAALGPARGNIRGEPRGAIIYLLFLFRVVWTVTPTLVTSLSSAAHTVSLSWIPHTTTALDLT